MRQKHPIEYFDKLLPIAAPYLDPTDVSVELFPDSVCVRTNKSPIKATMHFRMPLAIKSGFEFPIKVFREIAPYATDLEEGALNLFIDGIKLRTRVTENQAPIYPIETKETKDVATIGLGWMLSEVDLLSKQTSGILQRNLVIKGGASYYSADGVAGKFSNPFDSDAMVLPPYALAVLRVLNGLKAEAFTYAYSDGYLRLYVRDADYKLCVGVPCSDKIDNFLSALVPRQFENLDYFTFPDDMERIRLIDYLKKLSGFSHVRPIVHVQIARERLIIFVFEEDSSKVIAVSNYKITNGSGESFVIEIETFRNLLKFHDKFCNKSAYFIAGADTHDIGVQVLYAENRQ
jgi:hypothetical protein